MENLEEKAIRRNGEQRESRREIIFWELENSKSVINLVSDKMRSYMRQLPPELLSLSEKEIRKRLAPGWIDEQLRIAFWDEYFVTIDNNAKRMRMDAVYARVCARDVFYDRLRLPLPLAFICKPPQDYIYQMRSLLNIGMERFQEILNLPIEGEDGRINTGLIREIVKIVTIVDNRVKGAVTQKIQIDGTQKNLNMNINYEPPKTHQDIEKEIKEIEKEIRTIQNPMQERYLTHSGEGLNPTGEIEWGKPIPPTALIPSQTPEPVRIVAPNDEDID
ncbi:MAG TPA: hypothetical protein VFF49_04735 [Thermodesulfobacteriota bacterium]|nr:hypothetical protein [Thermodesulfobacteriota bacterium]